jgi:uncharacterized protein (TIGR02231 family)
MKHLRLASLLPLLLAPATMSAAPIAADSAIRAVTVYADRAIVTREAQVALPVGTQEVLFAGLPESLDPDLLQVSGEGSAKATILDVRAVKTQLEAAANPRLKDLLAQSRALQTTLRQLNDRGTLLQQERDYLEKIKAATVAPLQGKEGAVLPSVAAWEGYVAFYTERFAKLQNAMQELDLQRDDVQAKIAAVQREIKELEAPGAETRQDVFVRVDVTTAGTMTMRVAYTVEDAEWKPTYDVRVASADKSILLGYAAMVSQSTGEDWKGVKLVLSTARPSIGGTPPELSTWFLDERRPMPAAAPMMMDAERGRNFAESNFALATTTGGAEKIELSEFSVAAASVEAGLTSANFTIPYPADIPADNAEHKVTIASYPVEGKINHLAIPKLAERAYLRAAVTNGPDFPLIAGTVNLFLDGTFVARSELKTVMPAEKFVLDLGVDEGISVKRKLLNRLQENAGIISRKQRVTYDVLITVQNNRKTAETVVVKDQLPISKNEKITVELVAPPARDIRKDDDGTIVWTLELKPGEKRELPLKIAVEYPTDFPVEGLE